jgi:signal transduction histidine kinase
MQYHAANNKVTLDWTPPQNLRLARYKGDPFHLAQALTILVANAIDAYHDSPKPVAERYVRIRFEQTEDAYALHIIDHGKGISASRRKHIFYPVNSSKKTGMGIGLYLARQMVVTHFKGTLRLHPDMGHTEFTILLPKGKHV